MSKEDEEEREWGCESGYKGRGERQIRSPLLSLIQQIHAGARKDSSPPARAEFDY